MLGRAGWPDAVVPSYSGGSIGNIAATVLHALGCGSDERGSPILPPVAPEFLDADFLTGSSVVILIVLDGYGSRTGRTGDRLRSVVSGNLLAATELTSVFPSTTAAALTSLQTGYAPAQHGIAGYTLFLPEARRVVNMIQFVAVDGSSLPARVADPRLLLRVPTLYERLASQHIESVVVSHLEYACSPMTLLHSGDTPYRGHRTAAEFALMLLREARRPGPRFVFGYWAGVDTLGHTYGPISDEVFLERAVIESALIAGLLEPLATSAADVTIMLTADHGLATLREQDAETIGSLAKATGRFIRPPAGERRAVGLFTSDDTQRDIIAGHVGDRGAAIAAAEAIENGLFGPAPSHEELLARVGDTLLLARGSHSYPFRPLGDGGTFSLGAHGSLTQEEMRVPLLVWRFGA